MGGRAGEPKGIGGGVSFGLAVEEGFGDGVHDVRVLLVLCEERPDETRQSGGGGEGLKDVLGGGDWHLKEGERRGGILG